MTLCVLGMHRSGTTVTAQILEALGVDMGDTNHLCEDKRILEINQQILKAAGGDWSIPPGTAAIIEAEREIDVEGALEGRSQPWGFKDPRTCLTLPVWSRAIWGLKVVRITRRADDVILSLMERHQRGKYADWTAGDWRKLCDIYNDRADAFLRHSEIPRIEIRYEDLTDARKAAETVGRIASFVGVDDEERISAAIKLVERRDQLRRILIVCPIYDIFGRTLEGIFSQRWDGSIDYFFTEDNPIDGGARYNITANYIKAQRVFLRGDYDAMLTVESDMIIPADALDRLADCLHNGAGVARGLYCTRHGGHHWMARVGDIGVSLSQAPEMARESWGQVIETAGLGLGCTLIDRDALEQMRWTHDAERGTDWQLARFCVDAGVKQVCDTGVVCGHIRRRPPSILRPDPGADGLYQMEELC